MAKQTFKQRVGAALKREVAAQKVLNNPRSSKAAKAKAKRDIATARKAQRRNYRAAKDKIKSGDEKFKTKDAVRKGGKKKKKSSSKGKKTKATSKKTAKRSQRGKSKKK